jgi:hypothetical protein
MKRVCVELVSIRKRLKDACKMYSSNSDAMRHFYKLVAYK